MLHKEDIENIIICFATNKTLLSFNVVYLGTGCQHSSNFCSTTNKRFSLVYFMEKLKAKTHFDWT